MPAPREPPREPAAPASRASRLVRWFGLAVVIGVASFCVLLLALRYVVLPRIDSQRGEIASYLSRQLGGQVEIDALATGWDGWNPKIVVTGLAVHDRAAAGAKTLLELPQVEMVVSWTSLAFGELRLKDLVIDRPRLALRRDRAGRIHIAGIEIDPEATGSDNVFTDWLLKQRQIHVRDALIIWQDDRRNAPQLVLDQVQLRLDYSLGHHRFGVTGVPPPELASPLDLRGDLTGASFRDWQQANGSIYLRLDYADVAAWREWIPLPFTVERGKGALRMWFEFSGGIARDVTSDIELADLRLTLAPGLEPLELAHLAGRVAWKQETDRRSLTARGLSFVERDGTTLAPTDFTIALNDGKDGAIIGGALAFDQIELKPLAGMAQHLPLPEPWRRGLARHAPRGTVHDGKYSWEGPPEAPLRFTASGRAADLALVANGALPGVSGLSGTVEATERGGRVKLASRTTVLTAPQVFAEPLAFDRLDGGVEWTHAADAYAVRVDEFAFANADIAGTVTGSWSQRPGSPGSVDLKAQVSRADAAQLGRYLPVSAKGGTRDWIRTALVKGKLTDGKLRVAGNLADFPFAAGKRGTFAGSFKAQGLTLDYARGWPALFDVDAELRYEGPRILIDIARARILEADIARTRMEIADQTARPPVLSVAGEVTGDTSTFLQFIVQSPVAGWIDHFTDAIQASGSGLLALRFELPLGHDGGTRVSGEYTLSGNQLRVPGIPPLTQVNGKFAFDEHGTRASDIALEVMGGPAKVSLATAEGRVRVDASGTANLALLRNEVPGPFVDRLSGTTEWRLEAAMRPGQASFTLDAPLVGAVVDLPAPLGKAAAQALPLRIERREVAERPDQDVVSVDVKGALHALVHRKLSAQGASVDRALLLLGKAVEQPGDTERPGLWVRADVASLNVDDWLALRAREEAKGGGGGSAALALEGVDLEAGNLQAIGRRFRSIKVTARHAADAWRLTLAGPDVEGTATWTAPGGDHPNGRIVARLARLTMPGPGDLVPWQGGTERAVPADGTANAWPGLDIAAEQFISKDRNLGRLEVMAWPSGTDWHIDRLALTSGDGSIVSEGLWRVTGRTQQTRLEVKLDARDAGDLLARFGYPDAIDGAPTRIDGQLLWAGSPGEFDFPSLTGNLRLTSGAGRFTKIDPGIGKLLGVLSLQALPRRLTLDFRDVFSEGFAFDEIAGDVRIQNGVMRTDNLKIVGPAARVEIAGEADLGRETQQLKVTVQPSLATSFSAGTAGAAMLLLAANPLVAAAVGATALLAQKMMSDPIEQIFSYHYRISGQWSDPLVERVDRRGAEAAPAAAASAAAAPKAGAK